MGPQELLNAVESILSESSPGILAVSDPSGTPHMRWMTPLLLPGRDRALYAVISPDFAERIMTRLSPRVEWMLQNRALTVIFRLRGTIRVLDDPMLRSEVIEKIGKKLAAFWRLNKDQKTFKVLETNLVSAERILPMKGISETVEF